MSNVSAARGVGEVIGSARMPQSIALAAIVNFQATVICLRPKSRHDYA